MSAARPLYITTGEAVKILGLSQGAIQNLLDAGKLQGWKTEGGHRRILNSSIQKYLHSQNIVDGSIEPINITVFDSSNTLQDKTNDYFGCNTNVAYCTSAFEFATQVIKSEPDLCILSTKNASTSDTQLIHELINKSTKKKTIYIYIDNEDHFQSNRVINISKISKSWTMGFLQGFSKARELIF